MTLSKGDEEINNLFKNHDSLLDSSFSELSGVVTELISSWNAVEGVMSKLEYSSLAITNNWAILREKLDDYSARIPQNVDSIKKLIDKMDTCVKRERGVVSYVNGVVNKKAKIETETHTQLVPGNSNDVLKFGSAGGFQERFGAKPGKMKNAFPGQFITPKTLLKYMQLNWSFVNSGSPPFFFEPDSPGYISFLITPLERIETAGWKAAEAEAAAEQGKKYQGMNSEFVGSGEPFGIDDVLKLTEQAKQRETDRLNELKNIVLGQKKLLFVEKNKR